MTHRATFSLAITSLLLVIILASATAAQTRPTQTGAQTTYLPMIARNWPPAPSVFGAEIHPGMVNATVARAREARVSWVRYNRILWSEIEPTRGERRWNRLAGVDSELRTLSEQQLTPMVIVRGTPGWAQQTVGSPCGPIRADALDAFALFMRDLVARYSAPPYNITYWEIWNEPDAPITLVDAPYGCWGNPSDPYYGGRYYGEMLKRIYPKIKEANPGAQVVFGGLLLDCDPANPPQGRNCLPAKFLEGALVSGAGQSFDMLAFHGYPLWEDKQQDWDLAFSTWRHRGGVVLGKADFLRTVLRQHGISKPLILNEGGLLCWNASPSCQNNFLDAQANYAVRLYTRAWANDLKGAIWYTLDGPGWNLGGLLDGQQQPKPAYHSLRFMSNLLHEADYIGRVEHSATIEGYAFRKGATTYRVYWTNDSSVVARPLPAGTRALYNKYGQSLPLGGSVNVSFDPVFIESGP